MQFLNFKEGQFIDFLSFKRLAAVISAILILGGVASIVAHQGLKYGIDFRGGTNVQIQFSTAPDLDQLRQFFAEKGMKNVILQRTDVIDPGQAQSKIEFGHSFPP
jgi:preprotein translocase subunit SecF